MAVSTQRLNITQTWQQVATGNATLIGCNTSANYQIYVGSDTPNDKTAFVTDKLAHATEYNFNAPVWVKLNVNNQIDEADLIVVGEAVVPKPTATPLTFSSLQNCTYDNGVLTYTDGYMPFFDIAGYQAVTDKPTDFSITYHPNCCLYIGENPSLDGYYDSNNIAEGLMVRFDYMSYRLGAVKDQNIGMTCNNGDVLNFNIANSQVTITNTTTNQTWTSPQFDYLANPKYIGVAMGDSSGGNAGIDPLTIKAI